MPTNDTILILGESYSSNMVKIEYLGRNLQGVSAIEWDKKRDIVFNKGLATHPFSYSKGSKEASAKITMDEKEYEAIVFAAQAKGLEDETDLPPSPLTISIIDDNKIMKVTTLHNVMMTGGNQKITNEAKGLEMECPLMTSHVTHKKGS